MRIPVVTGVLPGAADAVLLEDGVFYAGPGHVVGFSAAETGHVAGCACCGGRGKVAEALGYMFLARARGDIVFFARVVVLASPAGEAAVRAALAADVVAQARYRLAGQF
jgi:hypothetical protein